MSDATTDNPAAAGQREQSAAPIQIPIQIVDAFADRLFTGQPAAIIPDATGLTDQDMLQIAGELGMEAGFVMPAQAREADIKLRYFTRRREATFSGHVSVAAFVGLADRGFFKPTTKGLQLHQETAAGVLPVTLTCAEEGRCHVNLEMPTPRFGEPVPAAEVVAALELPADAVGLGDRGPQRVSCGFDQILVPINDRKAMRSSFRNLDTMRALTDRRGASGFVLFSPFTHAAGADFHCRFIFPAESCCEEPVSGISVAAVAAYAVQHGLMPWSDRVVMVTEQGHSVGRPCRVTTTVRAARDHITGVEVSGTGAVVMRGAFQLDRNALHAKA